MMMIRSAQERELPQSIRFIRCVQQRWIAIRFESPVPSPDAEHSLTFGLHQFNSIQTSANWNSSARKNKKEAKHMMMQHMRPKNMN